MEMRPIVFILILWLFCLVHPAGVGASSVYFDPNQPFLFADKTSYGMFIGNKSQDPGKETYHGDQQAMMIASKFTNYGATVVSAPGSTGTASGALGSWIYNYAGLVSSGTFSNSENFLLYLTGHGIKSNYDNKKFGVVLGSNTDDISNIITNYDLAEYLKLIPKNVNKVVVIDACYSGGFIETLKSVKNISILTSSSSFTRSGYDADGSFFGREMAQFLQDLNGQGFTFDDMVDYIKYNFNFTNYMGMRAYELGAGDPITLTPDDFAIQTYQSPAYNPVPEPSTLCFLCIGVALIYITKRGKVTKI